MKNRKKILGKKNWPKVTCLKPLCGYDYETAENLKSFLNQDYPDYEVIFGSADKNDPVFEIARKICKNSAFRYGKVVFGEKGNGTNRKIRNLRNINSHVSPDTQVIIISDSDIRVKPDYLKTMVSPIIDNPDTGAVTALYRLKNVSTAGSVLEALSVETTFFPGVMVASFFSDLSYCFGASIALRRSDFIQAGGFASVENYLADDYEIGNRMTATGKKVRLAPNFVSVWMGQQKTKETFIHLVRWNRTIRVCQPWGYFFSVISFPSFWALTSFMVAGTISSGLKILLIGYTARIFTSALIALFAGTGKGVRRSILTPLWDVIAVFIWFAGLCGNTVIWRNVRYRLSHNGRIVEINET